MTSPTNHLDAILNDLNTAANNVDDSARTLAHLATEAGPIPAPAAYTVLGNFKLAMWRLRDAAHAISDGLRRSHTMPGIALTDHDIATGEPRDPQESLRLATSDLQAIARLLADAGAHADTAQAAISGQGYKPMQ